MNTFTKKLKRFLLFSISLVLVGNLVHNRLFVFAQNPVDSLIIENRSANHPELPQYFRELFIQRAFLWTEEDLASLRKIIIVDSQNDIGGVKGLYGFVKITDPSGQYQDWKGSIYVWDDGPSGETLAHEYGHHFTSYWAARRTNGEWGNHWPIDEAGDYYLLRPLPAGCYCELDTGCPYHQDIWEIIAEDYRTTVSSFISHGHIFVGRSCMSGTGTLAPPIKVTTARYIYALPIPKQTLTPITTLTVAPTSILIPSSTLIPTMTSSPIVSCPTIQSDTKSIKLGIGPPCYSQ